MFCSATLSAPNAHGIHLDFDDIALEYNHRYLFDYLLIFDGPDCLAPRLAVAYGQTYNTTLSSPRNRVSLLFISDYAVQNAGFNLIYRPETVQDQWKRNNEIEPNYRHILNNCGKELNESSSNIISWRGRDEANTLCIWKITNNFGGTITLEIKELKFKTLSGSLRILDGSDCGAEVINIFGQNTPSVNRTICGSSNAMTVVLSAPGEQGSIFNATLTFGK
ncbi:unnamed protein product [Dicrocoelium dendriticum]|nr:unnamed protein product [Dicrocoelium dendriticum]